MFAYFKVLIYFACLLMLFSACLFFIILLLKLALLLFIQRLLSSCLVFWLLAHFISVIAFHHVLYALIKWFSQFYG